MEEESARRIAEVLGGEAWNSGGGIWLVIRKRADGKVVAISDESVCVYDSEDYLQGGQPTESVIIV